MNFLNVKDLSYKSRNNLILKNLSVEFSYGGFYSIIGPNGSGKTTFIKHLIRALRAQEGEILLEGENINKYKAKEFAGKISYVPQIASFDMEFSCYDTVMMGRSYLQKGFSSESLEDINKVNEAMKIAGIFDLKDRSIREISGGERSRVFLARALCQDAKCIILDEPLAHLDIKHQLSVMGLLREINKKENKIIIVVNHDINLALKFSKKLIVFHGGKIEGEYAPEEFLDTKLLNKVYGLNLKEENLNRNELLVNFY
ncbi:ABC transporter ATP-binding protein [Clostridium paridis]|uniref:ABC transporter ATP-binding protein n=1 Tax=Clostridium paridis TaxID=2803863 RepID=A0A937FE99_9CLOT|nr:ABC transporter ATP-binding protein [Clostridium paridis]MBL4930247.1 ABC transporter ATP-binding protein [Clostridium paridis]